MAYRIAIANQKGGVGKTTISMGLAGVLAELGKKVLLIDMDQQGNLSSAFLENVRELQKTIFDLLIDEAEIGQVLYKTQIEQIHILPANIALSELDTRLAGDDDAQYYLMEALEEIDPCYDYIIIDCPPNLGRATRARPEYLSKDLRDQIFHMGRNPFISDVFHKVNGIEKRRDIIEGEPAIILSTSGMLTGGNSVEYFKWLCEDEKSSLVFVGYQSEGSLGRRIQKGWKEIPLKEDGKTNVYNVKMQITTIEGFSGHSDRKQLMDYIRRISPKPEKILVCHGDNYKTLDLASSIYRSYKIETKTPMNLETVRIQ